jgi:superfamily II DNA or RNA helicase
MRQNLTAQDQTDTAAETKKLRDYQAKAVNAAAHALTETDRTTVVMACGTGKTITSLRLLEQLIEDDPAPIAIVALPSLGLLGQTLTEWSRDAVRAFSAVAVCSDDEVAHSPEAGEIVVPVTTNSDDLGEWMTTTAGPRVVYTTYQSSPVVARALRERGEVADVLIADEAHRTASRDDATFATLLDDSRAPILRRVYLTATPRVHTSNTDDDLLLSMDDAEVYGDRSYTYSFSQAVEDDVLSDYQVAVVAMTNEEAKSLSSGTSPAQLQSTAAQAALVRAALDYDVHRAFVYSASVARSEDFAQGLPHVIDAMGGLERDRVTVDHLDSSTPLSHRRAMLGALAAADDDYVFLSNCRVLGEGVDAPALDAVVFADPKTSSIEIVQTVGRAMRKNPGREGPALIVLPVIVGDSDDPDAALAESNFRHVWATIRALSDMDPRFDNEIRRADPITGDHAGVDAAHSLSFIGALAGLRAGMVRALQLRTVDIGGAVSPDRGLDRLRASEFYREHGHINVPVKTEIDGWNAGTWLNGIRQKFRRGELDQAVVVRAESLGIEWNPRDRAHEYLDRFESSEFYREHGHINVPRTMAFGGWKAGAWLNNLRRRFRRGELDQAVVVRAESLGIEWNPRDRAHEYLDRLGASEFYREHGHINVPYKTEIGGWRAGVWLNGIRQKFRRGELDQAVVVRAESLGVKWGLHVSPEEGLDRLGASEFYREHGHINVPRTMAFGGWKAGAWVGSLRTKYRKGVLSNETVARAESLGIDWRPRNGG